MDLESEELHKSGRQVKLARQPFHMLAVIALGNGRLVTYAELQSKFWPQITIEDYKHSLSNSLHAIRKVLKDSARSPIYIQTLPTGFRFLVPVTIIEALVQPNGFGKHHEDDFSLELGQIQRELLASVHSRELLILLFRTNTLQKQCPQHPKMHELQLLILSIRLALSQAAFDEPNWANPDISFETGAQVFNDSNAISVPLGDDTWKTVGRVFGNVLLTVAHTGYQVNGRVKIIAVRRATPEERRFYERPRQ